MPRLLGGASSPTLSGGGDHGRWRSCHLEWHVWATTAERGEGGCDLWLHESLPHDVDSVFRMVSTPRLQIMKIRIAMKGMAFVVGHAPPGCDVMLSSAASANSSKSLLSLK